MGSTVYPIAEVALVIVGQKPAKDLRPGDWIEKQPHSGRWRKVLAVKPQPGRTPLEIHLEAMGEGFDFLVFLLPETPVQVARSR